MSKRILIAAGGSGGHLYPAMGTAVKLLESQPELEVLFAAGGLASNPFFDREAFAWQSISAAPLVKLAPWKFINNCRIIAKGILQSRKLLSSFKPDLVIGFGSYHTFPVLSAARLQKYPIVLHEQNSKPGKVIRLFSKYALMTGIYFPSASRSLKGKSMLLNMPLRDGFSRKTCCKEEACSYFGINSKKLTLLVFGGSQGAQYINQEVTKLLIKVGSSNIQVLHLAGNDSEARMVTDLYAKSDLKAVVKPLEKRMDYAWRAADLAIVRAGAGTIAEQIEFEVPAIFIPYPHAADGHQECNADFVVENVGGGWKWCENQWQPDSFSSTLQLLLQENSPLRTEKQHNLANYKKNVAFAEFSTEICKILLTS